MNNIELSNGFQTLINSYARFKDFDNKEILDSIEFDEYEKSLFLTKSQDEVVLSLYNGRNTSGLSFEETEELRRYLSNIIEEAELSPITTTNNKPLGIDSRSKFFTLPDNLWFITYEAVVISDGKCEDTSSLEVIPARQDEYHKLRKNPFRGPNYRRALRFDLSENIVEIVSKYNVVSYYVRYLKKLSPIVLEDMPDGVTIKGVGRETPCILHESLHERILENAVQMALQSKGYRNNSENK